MIQSYRSKRNGVVLLIVLGMLSLFTVLVVSFVVFSSQMAQTAYSNKEQQRSEIPIEAPIEAAITQLVSGTNDHRSAAFGHSLLEDLYGTDGVQMRVGHRRATPPNGYPIAPPNHGGLLLLPLNGAGQPETTLFKFPSNLVTWYYESTNFPAPFDSSLGPVGTNEFHFNQRPDLDDAFSGRLVTFDEGPLAKVTFRIVRSFGRQNGEPPNARQVNRPPNAPDQNPINFSTHPDYANASLYVGNEYSLAGCFIVDLSEMPREVVSIAGADYPLYEAAANYPNALLYDPGPDGKPGRANVDDNGNGQVDDLSELGTLNTDDFGYRFTMNGVPFNGRGQNPIGVSGLRRSNGTVPVDTFADLELSLNGRLMGPNALAGVPGDPLAFPEPDEQWDAAGLENFFLAWQPSDHRRVYVDNIPVANRIYTGVNADELNHQLGSNLVPSFHRPAVINYLMNAPIWIPQDINPGFGPMGINIETDPSVRNNPANWRTFNVIANSPDIPNYRDDLRLLALINRIRRATMRPLNVSHLIFSQQFSDLDGDGIPFDGAPGFTGSSSVPILNQTIDLSDITGNYAGIVNQVRQLAVWLINGPWDIDNDGDGLPDSLWVDMGLPEFVTADGTIIRPLVAPLIEDMDGKININYAGGMGQLVENRFTDGPARANGDRRYYSDAEFNLAGQALDSFGFGGGIGPAEIDFSHLFNEPTVRAGFLGPLTTNQVGQPLSFINTGGPPPQIGLLRSRYGNLLNVRNGGSVYDYLPPYPQPLELKFPAAGDGFSPAPGTSLLSRIPYPDRKNVHNTAAPIGRPVDMHGVMKTRKDERGQHTFSLPARVNDIVNQPYERGTSEVLGDDAPFTPTEQVDILENGVIGGRLSQLLGDAIQRNESLKNLIAVESRSLDSPEIPGISNLTRLLAQKLTNASVNPEQQQTHLDKMLAVELRKGSKLNLNRILSNGVDFDTDGFFDESDETETRLVVANNNPNNRRAAQPAFQQIAPAYPQQGAIRANYTPVNYAQATFGAPDFDGFDTNNDGTLDIGTNFSVDVDGDGTPAGNASIRLKAATGGELLARHLYVLMFTLIHDPDPATGELVPNFPYPSPGNFTDVQARNRFVARRLAQWAVNAVDFRDTNVARTRLRYDPNPFNGFDPAVAALNVVWGMEKPELEITEALAAHDKRTKRNLTEVGTQPNQIADDEDNDTTDALDPDDDMDQFRIPLASAWIELHSLRSPVIGTGSNQPSLPRELYTNDQLDLGRIVGGNERRSPVWRIAVGAPTQNNLNRSTRWLFDANRLGADLVATDGRQEELNYLTSNAPDWTDPMAVNDFVDNTWDAGQRHSAEIVHVPFPALGGAESVLLADPDFNPVTNNPHELILERFVWFANLPPNAAPALNIVNPGLGSGMRLDNVYYNRQQINIPGQAGTPFAAPTLVAPGEYAVVGPRQSTVFGQTRASTIPTYEYNPVQQRIEFALQGAGPNFRLNYFNLGWMPGNPEQTPRYFEDNNGAYHIPRIVPLVCESLKPHEVDNTLGGWANYYTNYNVDETVDMGFNISAPLPGAAYYPVPTYRINDNGANGPYPQVDGYATYTPGSEAGAHPDIPFDHRAGSPMEDNSYQLDDPMGNSVTVHWNSIGTHQEVRTVFLQRLADPSQPWHAVDNPYLTEDFMPIDLTTYNGEADVTEPVDRDGDGDTMNDNWWADSGRSRYDGTQFTPQVKMDSRRKIPAVEKDRVLTELLPNGGGGGLAGFDRVSVVKRSPLSATFSVLRQGPVNIASQAYWPHQLGSAWDNQNYVADGGGANDDPFDTRYDPALTFDGVGTPFTQTLGFVNREYGFPVRSDSPYVNRFGIGAPDRVSLLTVSWMDRDFQSPLDLMNVPAVSRTGLLATFSPGTRFDGPGQERELPDNYGHLLGFQSRYSRYRPEDTQQDVGGTGTYVDRYPLQNSQDAADPNFSDNVAQFTGERAGFEQIFDYVDTGAAWFDSQRWIDPLKVTFRDDSFLSSQTLPYQQRAPLFNRVVATLQPPFNYIGKHRTPGKINPNTTPDYVRKGPNFQGASADVFLDANEAPETVSTAAAGANYIQANPVNDYADSNGFTREFVNNSRLYGNGSVYRALTWGISTPYELDSYLDTSVTPPLRRVAYGSPSILGASNAYMQTVDTPFGHSFKAFIESRRGFADSYLSGNFRNEQLDARFPTRFAGVFSVSRAASLGSVQRFMRGVDETNRGAVRRTHDMGLLRPHPDFDERFVTTAQRSTHQTPGNATYTLAVEADATANTANDGAEATGAGNVQLPAMAAAEQKPSIQQLRYSMMNTGLFERPQSELHKDFRNLDRDSFFRYQNAAKLANLTTPHSNVFLIRLTTGYFVVDPVSGSVSEEYVGPTGEPVRARATVVVDRSIPVGFLRGKKLNTGDTVIYQNVEN